MVIWQGPTAVRSVLAYGNACTAVVAGCKAPGDDWKMEVLGAPPCSDVAMAPTFALGACPQSRPKR